MNLFYKKNYIYFFKYESWFFLIIENIFKKFKIFNLNNFFIKKINFYLFDIQ